MKRRSSWVGALLPALAALALVPAASARTEAEAARAPVQTVRLAGGNWGFPTPFAHVRGPGLINTSFVFDTLIWKDATGRYVPLLARSWERSRDAKQYRFQLRRGVTWSDGRPFTAADVAFTFEYASKGPGRTTLGVIGQIAIRDAQATGPYTVVVRLDRPSAIFEETVAGRLPIVPRHIWANVTEPARFRGPSALVGTGPYRATVVDEATGTYEFVAKNAYFLGRPVVRRIQFSPVANPMLELRRGRLHSASASVDDGVPDSVLRSYPAATFGRLTASGENTVALHFNQNRGFPYSELRFRQGIAFAVDRRDMVRRLLFGRGVPASMGGLGPRHPFLAPGLRTYDHNLATARSLLFSAGLRDVNGDGMRQLPDGKPFVLELQTNSSYSAKVAELVQQYLARVGIEVRIRSMEPAAADAASATGNYAAALVSYGGLGGDPDWLRMRFSQRVQQRAFYRVHGFSSSRFEDLAAAQVGTVAVGERRRQVHEMQRILANELPIVPLYVAHRLVIFDKKTFDTWYFTPGGVFGLYPWHLNKLAFVTGRKVVR
jgi:peptide/nickel transport system substrate-binding protein